MVERNHGPETCYEERVKRRLQVVYARQTHEKQIFMEELKGYRSRRDKQMLKSIVNSVGPRWYQALSVPQRAALDTLEFSIYQDLLEARPHRTAAVMRELGLFPRPHTTELLHCIYMGRNDPKEMIAQLYLSTYGYPIEGKRSSYCLNARLMLSAILYLGLKNLIYLLQKRFAPDVSNADSEPKPKPKPEPPLPSPYLEKMVATLYLPPRYRRPPPPPLPNLDDLNEPYEEEPVIQKPPPPPPPPPPPKKRLPQSYCDKLAGIVPTVEPQNPQSVVTSGPLKKPARTGARNRRTSKLSFGESSKKSYGMGLGDTRKKTVRRKKPVAPTTGLWNAQYTINGVYQVHGKTLYVLGSITILPAQGELIHGGYRYLGGERINIHCGFRGWPPPPKPDSCDCLKKWNDAVFHYVKENKCFCGHFYDYKNEGNFPPDEMPYFVKPSRHSPVRFNYHTIFDMDSKHLHVKKEFKKIWETDSMLHVDDGTNTGKNEKKKKKKRLSTTCLGQHPKPEDYLKCALRLMRRVNVAARLPDLHLVPELKEWMRRRLYGSLTHLEKKEYLRKSTTYWQMFNTLAGKGYGHVAPPKDALYAGHTTWVHKQNLNDKFRHYTHTYKLSMFRSHAYVTNLLWRSMYQAEFPDKKFREIYFSYLYARLEDVQLIHPYSIRESEERKLAMAKRRIVCLPAGYEPKT